MKKTVVTIILALILLLGTGQLVLADEPAQPELTLNQAIERAIQYSETIKKAESEIDRTGALREQAVRHVDFVPAGGVGYSPALEASWSSLLQADLTWQMSKKTLDAKIDGLALDVCKLYWDVLKTSEKLKVKKISVEKARLELQKARIAYQLGMVSMVTPSAGSSSMSFPGLKQAEAAMAQAEAELASSQNELVQLYAKFNQLIGLKEDKRPLLVDSIEFHQLQIDYLESEVNRALERSPAVWQAERGVELQNYVQNLLRATGQYKPYEARQAEKEQAVLDAINAKEATKILVRDLYYSILNIEESYKSLEESIIVAEEALRVAELMYEVGMATKSDIISAKVTLAEAKQSLQELAVAHSYNKLIFQKPWAPMYSTL